MAFSGDPFQILGLPPGASDAEIKRAYRALAKRYHPDSAGETGTAAVPRHPGGVRHADDARPAAGRGLRSRRPPAPPRDRTSTADADRARATRDGIPGAAYPPCSTRRVPPDVGAGVVGRRACGSAEARRAGRRGRPPGPQGLAGRGSRRDRRARAAAGGADGTRQARSRRRPREPAERRRTAIPAGADRSPSAPRPRVATLGSTSYDDAPHEPEPSWAGRPGTATRRGRTGRSTPRSTRIRESTAPNTSPGPAAPRAPPIPSPASWPGTGDAGPTATPDPTTAPGPTSAGDPATSERARPQTDSGARTAPGGGSTTAPDRGPRGRTARSTDGRASARPESTRASTAGGPTAGGTSTSSAGPAGRTSTSASTGSASASAGRGFGAAPASAPRRPAATSPGRAFAIFRGVGRVRLLGRIGDMGGAAVIVSLRPPHFDRRRRHTPAGKTQSRRSRRAPCHARCRSACSSRSSRGRRSASRRAADRRADRLRSRRGHLRRSREPRAVAGPAGDPRCCSCCCRGWRGGRGRRRWRSASRAHRRRRPERVSVARGGPTPRHGALLLAILVMAYAVGLIGALSGRLPLPAWRDRPTSATGAATDGRRATIDDANATDLSAGRARNTCSRCVSWRSTARGSPPRRSGATSACPRRRRRRCSAGSAADGLVAQAEGRELVLTDSGRAAADAIFRRHALLEWLLTSVVGLGWAEFGRGGGAPPGRDLAARRGAARRDARPSRDVPARQSDRRRDGAPAAAGRSPEPPRGRRARDDLPDHRGGRGGQGAAVLSRGARAAPRRARSRCSPGRSRSTRSRSTGRAVGRPSGSGRPRSSARSAVHRTRPSSTRCPNADRRTAGSGGERHGPDRRWLAPPPARRRPCVWPDRRRRRHPCLRGLGGRRHADRAGMPCRFRLVVGPDFVARALEVDADGPHGLRRLSVRRDPKGHWWVNGKRRSDLDGRLDADVAATPLTNTPTIRRLGLARARSPRSSGRLGRRAVARRSPRTTSATSGSRRRPVPVRRGRRSMRRSRPTQTVVVRDYELFAERVFRR